MTMKVDVKFQQSAEMSSLPYVYYETNWEGQISHPTRSAAFHLGQWQFQAGLHVVYGGPASGKTTFFSDLIKASARLEVNEHHFFSVNEPEYVEGAQNLIVYDWAKLFRAILRHTHYDGSTEEKRKQKPLSAEALSKRVARNLKDGYNTVIAEALAEGIDIGRALVNQDPVEEENEDSSKLTPNRLFFIDSLRSFLFNKEKAAAGRGGFYPSRILELTQLSQLAIMRDIVIIGFLNPQYPELEDSLSSAVQGAVTSFLTIRDGVLKLERTRPGFIQTGPDLSLLSL